MLAGRISTKLFTTGGQGCRRSSNSNRTVICRGLKENVAALPSIEGIQQVVLQPLGHTIPNAEGMYSNGGSNGRPGLSHSLGSSRLYGAGFLARLELQKTCRDSLVPGW